MISSIKEFNEHFQIETNDRPGFLPDAEMKNRLDLQLEELLETSHAAGFFFNSDEMQFKRMNETISRNLPDTLDGLVDQMYVLMGTAAKMGFFAKQNPDEEEIDWCLPIITAAWQRVHEANMAKVRIPGQWKVAKPKGWVRPELGDLCV